MRLKGISSEGMKRIASSIDDRNSEVGSSPAETLKKHGEVHIHYLYGGGEVVVYEADGGFDVRVEFPDGRTEEFSVENTGDVEEVVDRAMNFYEEGMGGIFDEEGEERYFDYKWGTI